MHVTSMDSMREQIKKFCNPEAKMRVLDFGSLDLNGTYKPLFDSPLWEYVGSDGCPGKNVDIVLDSNFKWDIEPDSFDLVISGQVMEHVKAPWKMAEAIYRVVKPGGMTIVIAPWMWDYHAFPLDCWRIFPDGMVYVMSEVAGFKTLDCFRKGPDTVYVGIKNLKCFSSPSEKDSVLP